MSVRDEKVISQVSRLAAEYLNRESNGRSMITVTGAELSHSGQQATILISVWPESAGTEALNFTKRHRTELKNYVEEHLRIKRVPFLDFALTRKNSNNK